MEGQDSVASVLGPMSNSLDALYTFMESVVTAGSWRDDPLVIPKAWSLDEYQLINHGGGKQLCFGIMWDDGLVVPHPPVIRGLEIAKAALMEAGHTGDRMRNLGRSFVPDQSISCGLGTLEAWRNL